MKLNIDRPCLRLDIQRDGAEAGQLVLYPEDTGFLQRFFTLGQTLAQRQAPAQNEDPEQVLAALDEMAQSVRGQLDEVFGAGTAQMVFGPEGFSPAALEQFFAGVSQALEQYRKPLVDQYLDEGQP